MNRLYIVSLDESHGSTFASMKLGLSSGMFKVITKLSDCNDIPNNCIYCHDDFHPMDSVKISECLNKAGGFNLRDFNNINTICDNLINILNQINQLYGMYMDTYYTSKGKEQLTNYLYQMGYKKESLFEFSIGRDAQRGYFFIYPTSSRMEVIINLFKSRVYQRNKQIEDAIKHPYQINDPNGYLGKF